MSNTHTSAETVARTFLESFDDGYDVPVFEMVAPLAALIERERLEAKIERDKEIENSIRANIPTLVKDTKNAYDGINNVIWLIAENTIDADLELAQLAAHPRREDGKTTNCDAGVGE